MKVQVNVRFDEDMLEKLQVWAEKERDVRGYNVSVSDGVRLAVRWFFADLEASQKGAKKK